MGVELKHRVRVDLPPETGSDEDAEVDRAVRRRATTRADVGQGTVNQVVPADPEGHELWIVPRG